MFSYNKVFVKALTHGYPRVFFSQAWVQDIIVGVGADVEQPVQT